MSQEIDNLIDNIYKSEQESQAQQVYLEQLKAKTAIANKQAEEITQQVQFIEEEIAKKMKRLANREVELLTLTVRKKCLDDRNRELNAENKDLRKMMEELQVQLKASRDKLCGQVNQFLDEGAFFKKETEKKFPRAAVDEERTNEENCLKPSVENTSPHELFLNEKKDVDDKADNFFAFDINFSNEDIEEIFKNT